MSHKSSILFVLLLLIAAAVQALGQVRSRVVPSTDGVWSTRLLVTATVSKDQVRLTALALTQRMRLEVLSQTGEPLYDSDFQPGNRMEWGLKDQQGSELRDGVYGCIVTVEDLNGQVSHRRGILQVRDGAISFDSLRREVATSDEQESLTILSAEDSSPFTLVSHDGKEGWIESASGGLSFYAGCLARNRDSIPHLRLTPEGNVGIGVSDPQAKLDVAGLIRASEGFQFSDGTILKVEGGVPVLVTERSNGRGGNSVGTAPKANRVLATGRTVGMLSADGFPGKVFGSEAGFPFYNTLYGVDTGSDTAGVYNSFFGATVGQFNTTGNFNSFFGAGAGHSNTNGSSNSYFGLTAGSYNTTGSYNSFFGYASGGSITTENNNTFVGAFSDGNVGVTNATAIGAGASVTRSNSVVLGSINGTNVGIGVTAPQHRLHVESAFEDPYTGGRATYSYSYFTPASDNGGYIFGLESAARYEGGYRLTANHLAPGYALSALTGYYGGTVTASSAFGGGEVATVTGVTAQNIMRADIAVSDAIGVQIQPAIADMGAVTVSNVYGAYVRNPYGAFTPANVYGLYTEDLTKGTNNYGVYVSGNSKSYFGGNVGIGTLSPTEKLHVIGNMRVSGSILYGTGAEPVPDYVFDPGYELMPVEELGRFVEKEKHLPNVPSAAEMKEKGLNLGEFQMKLLEKIEELTLYTVQQAKTIREQQQRLTALEQIIAQQVPQERK